MRLMRTYLSDRRNYLWVRCSPIPLVINNPYFNSKKNPEFAGRKFKLSTGWMELKDFNGILYKEYEGRKIIRVTYPLNMDDICS